jgi:hypothetical protein
MELKDKKAVIAKEKRCSNCFGLQETIHCFNSHQCQICKSKHHTALCAEKETRFGASTVIPNTTVTAGCCSVTTALASSSDAVILETATVHVIGPDGRKTRGILLIDGGSQRTWIKQGISKQLNLEKLTVEEIGTRGFRQTVPSQTEKHNLVKFQVRGTWPGAPSIPLKALEVDEVGSTGPYQNSQFARKLWLENENLADDRFERDDADEDEELTILVGKDQQYEILFNEPAEISPCGLRAFNSHLGKVVSGPKKED